MTKKKVSKSPRGEYARELERLNEAAAYLNREAEDVLKYQADLDEEQVVAELKELKKFEDMLRSNRGASHRLGKV